MAKKQILSQPFTICLTYMIVGILWILLSDKATSYIFSDDILTMTKFQLFKGIFYVIVTGIFLYFLIKKLFDRVNNRNQELELLFTNPNLGILKMDENGHFTEMSQNISKITGYSSAELIGKHISHYTPEHRKSEELDQLRKIKSFKDDEGFTFRKHICCKDGKEVIIKGYGIRVISDQDNKPSYIAAFQNITDQVQFLQELEAHNQQLRDIASAQSHLVRAPLARILGITNLFEEDIDLSEHEIKTLLQNLGNSGQELDLALKQVSKKMTKKPE